MLAVYWGAGRECRYSGARRSICGIRWYWDLLTGVGGHWRHQRVSGVSGVH